MSGRTAARARAHAARCRPPEVSTTQIRAPRRVQLQQMHLSAFASVRRLLADRPSGAASVRACCRRASHASGGVSHASANRRAAERPHPTTTTDSWRGAHARRRRTRRYVAARGLWSTCIVQQNMDLGRRTETHAAMARQRPAVGARLADDSWMTARASEQMSPVHRDAREGRNVVQQAEAWARATPAEMQLCQPRRPPILASALVGVLVAAASGSSHAGHEPPPRASGVQHGSGDLILVGAVSPTG